MSDPEAPEDDGAGAEWTRNITYRIAYELAADHFERDTHSLAHGRRQRTRDTGNLAEEIARHLNLDPEDRDGQEAVREAIEDAAEGRRPRW